MKGFNILLLVQALQSLSNSIKVPIKSPVINGQQVLLMPTKPLQVQPKNLIIAIDMDPEQWKKLPLAEQQKIIAQKRAQLNKTQQQLITIAIKKPPTPIVPGQRVVLNSASGSIGPQKPKISYPNKPLVQPPGMSTGSLLPKSGGPIANSGTYSFTDLISEKKHESEVSGLRPLPKLKKVHLPESLEYKSFGSILMITEFVDIFKGFLMTDENFPIKTDEIIEAVSQKKESETVLKILLYFLKVLLGNECYKIKSLKIELADLPLTEFTVSFLVEQFLKSYIDKKKKQKQAEEMAAKYSKLTESGEDTETDMDGDDEPFEPPTDEPIFLDSEDEDEYYGYSLKPKQSKKKKKPKGTLTRYMIEENRTLEKVTNISKFLEKSEFHHLPPDHQIETLAFLMQLVMDSEEFLNYHEEIARDRMDAIRDLELYRRKKREEYVAKHPTPSTQTLPINKFMVNPTIKEPQANKIVVNLDGTVKEKPKNEEAKKDDQEKKDVKDEASKDEKKTDNEEKKDEKIEEKKDEKIEEKKDEKIEEKKEDDDLYAGMTERQIQAIKDEAKKAEMDKMEKLKEDLEKERLELDELKRKIKVATDLCNDAQRIEPLGYDRHDRSYWLFSRNNPGIYVSSLALWYIIDNGETIKDLTSALTVRGIREDRLKRALLRLQPEIKESIQVLKESGTSILKDDFKDMQSKGCSISVIKNDGTRTIYGKLTSTEAPIRMAINRL
ncbi:tyrosine-protein kinase BAZ1B-like [Clytia hemisphaerica]